MLNAALAAYSAWSAYQGQKEANQQNINLSREQMAWSAHQAQLNRDWQEHMSSTSHQREVKDLKEAGLNPILSASRGAPIGSAAMPSATLPHVENTKKYNPEIAIASAKLANEARLTTEEIKKIREETRIAKSQGDLQEQESKFWTSGYGKALLAIRHTMDSGLGSLLGIGGIIGGSAKVARAVRGSQKAAITFARAGRR